jgi:hypothetical protein
MMAVEPEVTCVSWLKGFRCLGMPMMMSKLISALNM